jgi:hypothetical protein
VVKKELFNHERHETHEQGLLFPGTGGSLKNVRIFGLFRGEERAFSPAARLRRPENAPFACNLGYNTVYILWVVRFE